MKRTSTIAKKDESRSSRSGQIGPSSEDLRNVPKFLPPFLTNQTVLVGTSVVFQCNVTSDTPPIIRVIVYKLHTLILLMSPAAIIYILYSLHVCCSLQLAYCNSDVVWNIIVYDYIHTKFMWTSTPILRFCCNFKLYDSVSARLKLRSLWFLGTTNIRLIQSKSCP